MCAGDANGWTRRQFVLALSQAALALTFSPRAARGFTIYDEAGDVTIGREADPEILKRFGYYESPDLQNYVAQVGQ